MITYNDAWLAHHGIRGQKWGVRRFQNEDGSLTQKGKDRYKTPTTDSGPQAKTVTKDSLQRLSSKTPAMNTGPQPKAVTKDGLQRASGGGGGVEENDEEDTVKRLLLGASIKSVKPNKKALESLSKKYQLEKTAISAIKSSTSHKQRKYMTLAKQYIGM